MNYNEVALMCASSAKPAGTADLQVCDVRHAVVDSNGSCQQPATGWDSSSLAISEVETVAQVARFWSSNFHCYARRACTDEGLNSQRQPCGPHSTYERDMPCCTCNMFKICRCSWKRSRVCWWQSHRRNPGTVWSVCWSEAVNDNCSAAVDALHSATSGNASRLGSNILIAARL